MRFIPVLTGNSRHGRPVVQTPAVYPRTHGEQTGTQYQYIFAYGLSPYSRGTVLCMRYRQPVNRFIPVLTGNRAKPHRAKEIIAVYPRTHGEQFRQISILALTFGLSPYSRGTAVQGMNDKHRLWFIPVLTGNRNCLLKVMVYISVYPRTHGEQVGFPLFPLHSAGLSPYSRGTAAQSNALPVSSRFIPVLTGNRQVDNTTNLLRMVYPRTHGEQAAIDIQLPSIERFIPVLTGNRHNILWI